MQTPTEFSAWWTFLIYIGQSLQIENILMLQSIFIFFNIDRMEFYYDYT